MAADLISVPLGATAKDAAELMLKKNISSVAVREGGGT
jgi:CBS domain-containing protein